MFEKESWKPGTMVYPAPAVLVSCGSTPETSNFLTVAWTGTINTNPPMLSVSIRPERHSYDIIRREMQFTVNLTTASMAHATDWAGVRSGRDYDKWAETRLTRQPGVVNTCFAIAESPLSIECRVTDIIPLGSHHLFIARVVNLLADKRFIDPETGTFDLAASGLMAYSHGKYYELGRYLGHFGFSVKKKK